MFQYAIVAFELAQERAREADRHLANAVVASRPSRPRRALAGLFALNSLASAGIARRLDAGTADRLDAVSE